MTPPPPLRFKVEIENPAVFAGIDVERVKQALRVGALWAGQQVQGRWIAAALRPEHGLDLRGSYIQGIQDNGTVEMVSEGENGNLYEVVVEVTNTDPKASLIEDGAPAYHLPDVIDWGKTTGSIKRGPNGPYLHIPFRHRAFVTPGVAATKGYTASAIKAMMPKAIYQQAKALTYTQSRGVGRVYDAAGQFIQADRYNWGTRLSRPKIPVGSSERRGPQGSNPEWKSSKYHGLFKTGTTGNTAYMTIRTMTPNSPGWNIPAKKGLGIARMVAQEAEGEEFTAAVVEMMMGALATGEGASP